MPSIRTRLLVILLGAFALVWASAVAITYHRVRVQVEEHFDRQLSQNAQVLWLLFSSARTGGREAPDDPYAGRIMARFGINQAFQVWDGEELVARSPNAPERRMALGYGASTGVMHGEPWRFYYRVDALRGLDVIVGSVLSERRSLVAALVFGAVWPLLAGLPLLALLVVAGVQQGLRPLRSVVDSIKGRRPDSLSPVPDQGAPREVGPLIQALNDLLDRLQSAMESERRFTANASHELRTPLAALKAQAQLARRAETEVERLKALEAVVAGVDRATHLLEQLLTLARLDPDTQRENGIPVEMKGLAEEVLAELDAPARRSGIELQLRGESAMVLGRPAALAVLLRNLVENAIRHSGEGGVVEVTVDDRGDTVALSISDQGPGIPAGERQRVFDRFYRRLGTDVEGSGLGLSIVARVAEVHGAIVTLADAGARGHAGPGGGPGLLVRVRFPAMSVPDGEP